MKTLAGQNGDGQSGTLGDKRGQNGDTETPNNGKTTLFE